MVHNPSLTQELVQNFATPYGNRKFVTVFTTARYWPLSRARKIQSTPSRAKYLIFIATTYHNDETRQTQHDFNT
jgi:hypothetical protein